MESFNGFKQLFLRAFVVFFLVHGVFSMAVPGRVTNHSPFTDNDTDDSNGKLMNTFTRANALKQKPSFSDGVVNYYFHRRKA